MINERIITMGNKQYPRMGGGDLNTEQNYRIEFMRKGIRTWWIYL